MQKNQEVVSVLSYRRIFFVLLFCIGISSWLFYREFSTSNVEWSLVNLKSTSLLFLLLALLMMVFRDLAYMVRIRMLTNRQLSWKQSMNVILVWEFASALTPGVVGGSAVAMFILQREKIALGKSTAIVLVTAILDNFFYILIVPVLLFFVSSDSLFPFQSDFANNNGYTLLWVAYSIIVLINLILGIGIFVRPQLFGKMALWIYRLPFLKKRKAKAEKFSEDILIASVELKGKTFGFWFRVFAVTCWSWLSRYLVINFLLLAFLDLTFFDHLVVLARQLVMWLGMIIPSTPGGTGVAEYLFGFFLADFIPNGPLALSLAFIWRLISYYPYLLIGSIVLPRWLGRKKSETSV